MRVIDKPAKSYDTVIIGSGFASTFFLYRHLTHASPDARILVLERGKKYSHADQIEMGQSSDIRAEDTWVDKGRKQNLRWKFTIAFGGGSNCWWGNAVRLHPSDFNLKTNYGVGLDWPLNYDDIEPYYGEAEAVMQVSGPKEPMMWPRSTPFPLPPHTLPMVDRLLKDAYPGHHFAAATARPSRDTATRPRCCSNGVCHLCPIDSKFTILNSFMAPYEDPRVEVLLSAEARAIEVQNQTATGVMFRRKGKEETVSADLVVLGANALFNPAILQRSGIDHPMLGRRLHGSYSDYGEVFLDGVDNFQGSSVICGMNYAKYDGDFRRTEPSVLLETWNRGPLRSEFGKWRQVMPFTLKLEDLPQDESNVRLAHLDDDLPEVTYEDISPYTMKSVDRAEEIVAEIMAPLPVESVRWLHSPDTIGGPHIYGTTMMGADPKTTIIDADQIHHRVRNLAVVGSGGFPAGSQSNPTLTICALAMKAADKLGASA